MQCLKAMWRLRDNWDKYWENELRFSIGRFFEQSAFVSNHQLRTWPNIHNSISKICPKFQVLSFNFSEVDELLDELGAKIVRTWLRSELENILTPIYVQCDNMYQ